MPPVKRRKLSDDKDEPAESPSEGLASELEEESDAESSIRPSSDEGSDASANTDDDLEGLQPKKSKKTAKRKLRATGASTFGAALQSLLQTDAPSNQPLSLKPSIARKHNDQKLELKAKKVLQLEKKEKEDLRRIKDVIGGWGGESERTLRKVAQRGVVKLFNAIQQSQATVAAVAEEAKAEKGSGKPRLAAPTTETKGKKKGSKKDNILGRGKETVVDKDDFFNIIKSGGIVAKA